MPSLLSPLVGSSWYSASPAFLAEQNAFQLFFDLLGVYSNGEGPHVFPHVRTSISSKKFKAFFTCNVFRKVNRLILMRIFETPHPILSKLPLYLISRCRKEILMKAIQVSCILFIQLKLRNLLHLLLSWAATVIEPLAST